MLHLSAIKNIIRRPKRLLAWFILFSFACGPGPLDFEEYFTLFNPATADRPPATDYYFFTHNYLNFNNEEPDSQQLSDSLNLNTWYNYAGKKISKEDFRKGLYERTSGLELARQLRGAGKTQAADYIILAQEIDKETEKYGSYWQAAEPVNEQLIADYRDIAESQFLETRDDFLKERYAFQIMKIDAKLGDFTMLLDDYNKLSDEFSNKTYISKWIESRVAGAHLALGDTARAVLEFARIFDTSPTRRNQADLSVRRLRNSHFEEAHKLAENDADHLALFALQAIQPYEDGLSFMQEIAALDVNYPMLELIMTREINKNEVNFYSERNSGLYAWSMDVYDENYQIDSVKLQNVKANAASYFNQLETLADVLSENKQLEDPNFWYATLAYLHFIDGDFKAMKADIDRVSDARPQLKKQVTFLDLLYELETENLDSKEADIFDRITDFKQVDNFREDNLLVYLSERLAAKYLNSRTEEKSGGWLSSCFSGKKQSNQNETKAFLARMISASDEDWGYENQATKPGILEKTAVQKLKEVIDFISNPNPSSEDKKLVELAHLDITAVQMAYARKLVKTQQYDMALEVFNQMPDSTLSSEPFLMYFSPIPPQFIGSGKPEESLLNAKTYFEKVVASQHQTEKEPTNAKAWYELGLAAYNMSYWGNGWLFSERYKSSMEIEYGQPTDEDYFTNSFAKECFEKALAANPEPELGAKICYMGALCERNQYYIAYTKGLPNTYKQEELDYYRIKMETSVKPTFQSFFKRLKNQYDETAYEHQVIKECMTYVNYKLQ